MKRILTVFLLVLINLSVFAQDMVDNDKILEEIKKERTSYADVLNEIATLSTLVEKKFLVKKLYKEGNLSEIQKIFDKDQNEIDDLYAQSLGDKLISRNQEMKAIYKGIDFIAPYLEFNNARGHYLKKEIEKTQMELENLIQNYPDFALLNDAILLLQEIYFQKGMHKEFISLYVKSTNKNSDIQKYWLGHSYYNIGNYEEAKHIFSEMVSNKNFELRAKEMLALISYSTEGAEVSIQKFTNIAQNYSSNNPYYSYSLLTLARLYIEVGEIDLGLQFYDLYAKKHQGTIPDRILLEIGILNKNNKKYAMAIQYFKMIMNKPVKSEYYPSAKILATISQQQSGHYENLESGLTDIISLNDVLLQTLDAKYGLMDKFSELRNKLRDNATSPEKKKEIQDKITRVETQMLKTNDTLKSLYTGNDVNSLAAIDVLEQEYLYYADTIDMMNSVVDIANTTPNKRIPRLIDKQIDEGSLDLVSLNVLGFIGHLPKNKVTKQDYELAQTLAVEKIYDEQLIDTWYKVADMAKKNGRQIIASLADQYVKILNDNLDSYEVIAKYSFNGEPPAEFKELIKEEIASIDHNNQQLEVLKKDVIEKFNKKIAKRLEKQKEVLVVENGNLRSFYDKILNKVKAEVKAEKDKNEFTLLDILFKQTKAIDMEYQVRQEKFKEIETQKIQEKVKSE